MSQTFHAMLKPYIGLCAITQPVSTRTRHPRRRIGLIKIDPKRIIGEKPERPFLID
jgi:hypothetical protein